MSPVGVLPMRAASLLIKDWHYHFRCSVRHIQRYFMHNLRKPIPNGLRNILPFYIQQLLKDRWVKDLCGDKNLKISSVPQVKGDL